MIAWTHQQRCLNQDKGVTERCIPSPLVIWPYFKEGWGCISLSRPYLVWSCFAYKVVVSCVCICSGCTRLFSYSGEPQATWQWPHVQLPRLFSERVMIIRICTVHADVQTLYIFFDPEPPSHLTLPQRGLGMHLPVTLKSWINEMYCCIVQHASWAESPCWLCILSTDFACLLHLVNDPRMRIQGRNVQCMLRV